VPGRARLDRPRLQEFSIWIDSGEFEACQQNVKFNQPLPFERLGIRISRRESAADALPLLSQHERNRPRSWLTLQTFDKCQTAL
jgi:hypothetical protein